MKNIVVVGFGAMGCRHVQALLKHKQKFNVHVVEPSRENIETNCSRIGAQITDCNWYSSVDELKDIPDIGIVATSSGPRFEITKRLIEIGVKQLLLEKIVFQSKQQFDQIIELIKINRVVAYCNFVTRYFNAYNDILGDVGVERTSPLTMSVYGGEFGMGTSTIHYLDIFQYITRSSLTKVSGYAVKPSAKENRRGQQYMEFNGIIRFVNEFGDNLQIVSDERFTGGGVTISVSYNKHMHVLNEESLSVFSSNEKLATKSDFHLLPTSKLTDIICEEIDLGTCRLTRVEETYLPHLEIFKVFNEAAGLELSEITICPIT